MTQTAIAPLLEVRDVSKTFGGERALDGVSLEFRKGEILALVGHNGSGKSTLVKVLTGFHDPDPGAEVRLGGDEASFGKAQIDGPAGQLPVRVVYQDGGLVLGLDAVDNIALMTGYRTGAGRLVDWKEQRRRARAALERVQAGNIDLDRPIGELKMIERAQIAIARAVSEWDGEGGLLLLDEPTSALTDHEAEHLFGVLRTLRDETGVSIVYVSHRLDEILRLADRVAVLRDGRLVATRDVGELEYDELVSLIIGAPAAKRSTSSADLAPVRPTAPTLSVKAFSSGAIRDLSFDLAPGEIVGITGLAGSGHEQIPYLLVGAEQASAGTIAVRGREVDARAMMPRMALALGLALVPADRLTAGLVSAFRVGDNISLPKLSAFTSRGRLRHHRERAYTMERVERFGVEPANPDAPVLSLSGGNQQKVVMGKSLGVAETALLLAEPTAGVDVGARATIYDRLRREAECGLPILVCSSDTEDLVGVCHRVLVMRRGRVVDELAGADVTEAAILHACGRDRT